MKAVRIPINWNPNLSIFASEPFLRAVGDDYGWLGGHGPDGQLLWILPFTIIRRPLFRMARFRTETIRLDSRLSRCEETRFLNAAIDYFRAAGIDLVLPATTNAIFQSYPDGAEAVPYGTWEIDLRRSEEEIRSPISAGHRRLISKAERMGTKVRVAPELTPVVHRILTDTFARSSMGFPPLATFQRYLDGLGKNVCVFVAEHGTTVQAASVMPFSQSRAYYVYGGNAPNAVPGAMHLLQWTAIRYFRARGVATYDFAGTRINPSQGSKQAGIAMFKRHFGARLVEGYMWKRGIKAWKYAIYNLLSRHLRGGDIVDEELRRSAAHGCAA